MRRKRRRFKNVVFSVFYVTAVTTLSERVGKRIESHDSVQIQSIM